MNSKCPKNIKCQRSEEWRNINWSKIERYILKLQLRIYSASLKDNIGVVGKLQHTLIESRQAKLLAVF